MTTTTCSRCGSAVTAGAHFCSLCGNDVSGQQGSLATQHINPQPARTLITDQVQLEQLDHLREVTLGEYEVYGELGRGGMATVYLAHDIALGRKVAIKVMAPALVTGEGMVERFKREARTAASLSHPNIIPVYAVRETERLLFFVMKFVQGRPLDSIMKEVGPLPIPMIQAILQQVGGAFDYAHRRGIVHRDIKPANIMIDDEGWAVVTDFGIAKVSESQGLTMTGMTVGTPTYMSPEQCMAQEVTGASDQYSLGVVAYEMIVGKPPFTGNSMMAIMYGHFNDPPPPILREDCPPALRDAVLRMLEKDPARRWPTLQEAVDAIGAPPANKDDRTRTELISLARAGITQKVAELVRTPSTPIPSRGKISRAGRPAPPPTRAIATPAGASGEPALSRSRRPLLAAAGGGVILAAALLVLQPWKQASGGETAALRPESTGVTVVPESVPARPASLDSNPLEPPVAAPSTSVADTTTRQAPPVQPSPRLDPRARTRFETARKEATTARTHAVELGATAVDLRPGDIARDQGARLAARGQYDEGVQQLDAAEAIYVAAGTAALRREQVSQRLQPQPAPEAPANPDHNRQDRPASEPASSTQAKPPGGAPSQPANSLPSTPAAPIDERPAVEQAIRNYARAMESRDINQIRRAYPGIPEDQASNLEAFFKAGNTLKTSWQISEVLVDGESATAWISGKTTYMLNGKGSDQKVNWRAALTRGPGGWILESVK